MLCGLPGSGKSSLAKSLIDTNTDWISSDEIRRELFGTEEDQRDGSVVFDIMRKRTEEALKVHRSVIYDACNINSKFRIELLTTLKKFECEKICFVCATPYEFCIDRNSHRDRIVDESVIQRMYTNWNSPYFYEGWNSIQIHYPKKCQSNKGRLNVRKDVSFIGEGSMDNVEIARQLLNESAYDALFINYMGKKEADVLEISCLIGLYTFLFLRPHKLPDEAYKKIWGEEIYQKVISLRRE